MRNNELHTVTAVEAGKVTLVGVELGVRGALHLDRSGGAVRNDVWMRAQINEPFMQ